MNSKMIYDDGFWQDKIAKRKSYIENQRQESFKMADETGGSDCTRLSELVEKAIQSGKGGLYYKDSVFFDCEFNDAVDQALVNLGLSSDDIILPNYKDQGFEFLIQF